MTPLWIILITLPVGILIGWMLPMFMRWIERRRKFDAYQAKLLVKQKRMEIRNSRAFKKRLSETIKMIKEESTAEKRELRIIFHGECRTDKELEAELNSCNFETYQTHDNMLKISW